MNLQTTLFVICIYPKINAIFINPRVLFTNLRYINIYGKPQKCGVFGGYLHVRARVSEE